jgi:alkylation response protein AidB-like acyl-CoA dehydrogenase
MSEASHGTDVLGISTQAKRDTNGDWILNGRKYVKNGFFLPRILFNCVCY